MSIVYKRVALIGLGLIGSSIFWSLKRAGQTSHVTGYARSSATRDIARRTGLCDEIFDTAQEAVRDADLVILCVPVGVMGPVAAIIAPALKPGATVSDVGSVKRAVIDAVAPCLPDTVHFVPAHPLAGTEHSGPTAGHSHLFDGRYWIVVPRDVPDDVVVRFESFLTGLGSVTERMDADYHDKVLALTSHLPHLIAYTIVSTAVDLETQLKNDVIRFSASGFRDFTRIAASDPVMWRDVFVNNDEAVLEMLQRFSEDLSYLQRAIRWQEGDKLEALFSRTREIRRSIIDAGQD